MPHEPHGVPEVEYVRAMTCWKGGGVGGGPLPRSPPRDLTPSTTSHLARCGRSPCTYRVAALQHPRIVILARCTKCMG